MKNTDFRATFNEAKKWLISLMGVAVFIFFLIAAYIVVFGTIHGQPLVKFAYNWVADGASSANPFKNLNPWVEITCHFGTSTPDLDCKNDKQLAKMKAEEELMAIEYTLSVHNILADEIPLYSQLYYEGTKKVKIDEIAALQKEKINKKKRIAQLEKEIGPLPSQANDSTQSSSEPPVIDEEFEARLQKYRE